VLSRGITFQNKTFSLLRISYINMVHQYERQEREINLFQ